MIATTYGVYVVDKSGKATRASGWLGYAWDYPSPATGDLDGTFYFSSPSGIRAMNPDGSLKWMNGQGAVPTGEGGANSSYGTAPALDPGGTLYVFSNDGSIRALQAKNGQLLWAEKPALEKGEDYNGSQVLAGSGDSLFAGIGGAATAAFRVSNGSVMGRLRLSRGANISGGTPDWALGYDGVIFDGLYIFDSCGNSRVGSPSWSGNFITSGTVDSLGRYVAVTMERNGSLVTPNSAKIALYDSNATPVVGPTQGKGQPVAVGADATIYTVNCMYAAPPENRLYAYDPNLVELWHLDLGSNGKCQSGHVVLDSDGVLYLAVPAEATGGGTDILAIQTESPGLSTVSSWPSIRHDNRGTMWLAPLDVVDAPDGGGLFDGSGTLGEGGTLDVADFVDGAVDVPIGAIGP